MKSKPNIVAAGVAIMAVGVALGTTALRAQKADDHGPEGDLRTLIVPGSGSWLGVALKDISADQARDMKLGGEYGALVDRVEPDSPAAKAGLESGDVIVGFAGERVRSVAGLTRMVRETPAGRAVEIEVRRGGEKKTLTATVEPRRDSMAPLMSGLRTEVWPDVNLPVYDFAFGFGGPRLGVSVTPLTQQLGDYFGVKDGKGVLVREVVSGSAADKAGLKAGDCILKLDSAPIESADDLHRVLLNRRGESRDVTLTIVRNRQQQTLQVHLEPAPQPGHRAVVSEDSTLNNWPDADALEAEARSFAPSAEALARQADELRAQLESERGVIRQQADAARAQAKAAQDQARTLKQQMLDHKGEWQQQFRHFQQQLRALRDAYGNDVI
ncbi:MAG TPA: PDZ domain-containing protein [Terriglobia bacterium]|nr:PDZ domain-containing protein [Terriglobia bacterium]